MKNLFNSEFAKNSKFEENFVGNIFKMDEWLILVNQYDNFLKKINYDSQEFNIPKKIHQIWIGDKALPRKCLKWMNSWRKFNQDWEYKLWDEKNIKELDIKGFNIYSKKINPGYRSDILRYFILNQHGGIYIDTDFECVKPIPAEFRYYKFVAGIMFSNQPEIGNSILMSSPNSILLKTLLNKIKSKDFKNDINHIIDNSGPINLTRTYFDLNKEIEKETLVLPSNYFYPYPNFMLNKKINRYDEIDQVSVGIHHWEMSWMKGTILNRIKNKLRRII